MARTEPAFALEEPPFGVRGLAPRFSPLSRISETVGGLDVLMWCFGLLAIAIAVAGAG
jgi:hypothetical protein